MKSTLLPLAVIALTAPSPAQTAASPTAPLPGAAIVEVDFTQGPGALPPNSLHEGGEWRDGWLITANSDRVLLDAGYAIKNGRMDVTFTRFDTSGNPVAYAQPPFSKPTNPISLWERPELGRTGSPPGDSFVIKIGSPERYENKQVNFAARFEAAPGRPPHVMERLGRPLGRLNLRRPHSPDDVARMA